MNRTFKFRAWDNENKKMYQPCFEWGNEKQSNGLPVREWLNEFYDKWMFGGDIILEQWTGLVDKDGKPIYEGDIVRITDLTAFEMFGGDSPIMKVYTRNWQVVWGEVGFKAKYCDKDFDFTSDIIHDLPTSGVEFEVIGNIHDNEVTP